MYVLTGPCHLGNWLTELSQSELRLTVCQSVRLGVEHTLGLTTRCYFPLEVWCLKFELRRLLNCFEADPSENTARSNTCCVCWLPWKFCLSGCYLDTDLRKRYLVTGIPNMWEVSMGGSHTSKGTNMGLFRQSRELFDCNIDSFSSNSFCVSVYMYNTSLRCLIARDVLHYTLFL
jgi:hypothetical protein